MKKFGKAANAPLLRTFVERISALPALTHAAIEEVARALATEAGVKLGDLAQPVRLALTGTLASPPLFEMIEVLGLETTRRRVLALAASLESQGPELRHPMEETTTPAPETPGKDFIREIVEDDLAPGSTRPSRPASRPSRTATSTSATPSRSA